ncbi:MAG: hypothetical protein HOK49_08960 [Opitutae bacterium]|nr:hypothetical protein [Opitutae bacterium]MBT5690749.1 hypothetical protein [Opitutae bacterium]MBT6462656.1 hypothetical protein [Opitutae bacterium]
MNMVASVSTSRTGTTRLSSGMSRVDPAVQKCLNEGHRLPGSISGARTSPKDENGYLTAR